MLPFASEKSPNPLDIAAQGGGEAWSQQANAAPIPGTPAGTPPPHPAADPSHQPSSPDPKAVTIDNLFAASDPDDKNKDKADPFADPTPFGRDDLAKVTAKSYSGLPKEQADLAGKFMEDQSPEALVALLSQVRQDAVTDAAVLSSQANHQLETKRSDVRAQRYDVESKSRNLRESTESAVFEALPTINKSIAREQIKDVTSRFQARFPEAGAAELHKVAIDYLAGVFNIEQKDVADKKDKDPSGDAEQNWLD